MVQDNIPAVGAAGYTLLSELDDLTWDSWLSLADVATAMNTKAASQGAIFANSFTNTYLTYSGIALIFNHANLTAANSAAIFNEAGLTAANSAAIFNEAGLTAANSALIFNEAGFTAANKALVCNEAAFTFANKALMFREAGLSIANINAIIIHANITDDNAQQILSEITKANRDLTSADNIYELLDDWGDNKVTSRDGAGTTSTGFTNLFAHKDKFRPEWTVSANVSAAAGRMQFSAVSAAKSAEIASTFITGTWELDQQRGATNGDQMMFKFLHDGTHYYMIYKTSNTTALELYHSIDGFIIIGTWSNDDANHTFKATRDASGNFEIFEDGVSKGTVLNTTTTTSTKIIIMPENGTGGQIEYIDDLKVY